MRTAAAVRAVRDVDERARGVAVEQRVQEPQRPVCVRARARVCACVRGSVRACVCARACARSFVRARVCVCVGCAPVCVCLCARARARVCVFWSASGYVRVCLRVGARVLCVCARAAITEEPAALGEPRVVEERDDPRERRACAMGEPP